MPHFLDLMLTFRERDKPLICTAFRHETHLSSENEKFQNTALDRSGIRLQYCFNLLGVESCRRTEDEPWMIRQTAIYNNFDPQNNHCTWIVVKGNKVIRQRMMAELSANGSLEASSHETREGSLRSILATNSLVIEWSLENWSQYVEYLEEESTKNDHISQGAAVDRTVQEFPSVVEFMRPATNSPITSRQSTFSSWNRHNSFTTRRNYSSALPREDSGFIPLERVPSGESPSNVKRNRSWASRFGNQYPLTRTGSTFPIIGTTPTSPVSPISLLEPDDLWKEEYNQMAMVFNFEEVQRLNGIRKSVAEALQVAGQNRSTVQEIREHFVDLGQMKDFQKRFKMKMWKQYLSSFLSRTRTVEREFEKIMGRLKTILGNLDQELALVCISEQPDIERKAL